MNFMAFFSNANSFVTIIYQDIRNIINSKYIFITGVSTDAKSFLVLQMLSTGVEASFAPLPHSMKVLEIDDL